jgi:UDP-glucose 4-epimerase
MTIKTGSQTKPAILVTGGAGYIGSHTVLALKQAGYSVVILDNLVYGHQDLAEQVLQVELVVGDIKDRPLLDKLFANYNFIGVIHFAGFAYVGESICNPAIYYDNNVIGTLTLLQAMVNAGVKRLVFSSTCATYGVPKTVPIIEAHPQSPINPYGGSKLVVEQMLKDFDAAYGLKSVIFRYFNAAGAHPTGILGEDHSPEPHLLPLVLYTALGKRDSISVFGTDYPTRDGTCIRDYVHVCDLAKAHTLGIEYLLGENVSNVFNLANGDGFSVQEVIDTAKVVAGKVIKVNESPRRAGDPPILIGSSEKVERVLGWQPCYKSLSEILGHAWQWYQKRHGYEF